MKEMRGKSTVANDVSNITTLEKFRDVGLLKRHLKWGKMYSYLPRYAP
jgi:hypothetical protein